MGPSGFHFCLRTCHLPPTLTINVLFRRFGTSCPDWVRMAIPLQCMMMHLCFACGCFSVCSAACVHALLFCATAPTGRKAGHPRPSTLRCMWTTVRECMACFPGEPVHAPIPWVLHFLIHQPAVPDYERDHVLVLCTPRPAPDPGLLSSGVECRNLSLLLAVVFLQWVTLPPAMACCCPMGRCSACKVKSVHSAHP